jgi:peroxiredoxin Q/BCP
VGDEAPHFSLLSHEGTTVTLSEFRGKKRVLMIFYLGDDTPASTRQLSSFRDRYEMFISRDVVVLGINSKKAESHKAFAKKLRLPFPLLVDKAGKVAAAYGCRASDGKIKQTIYVIGPYARVELAQRGDLSWIEVLDAIDEARHQGPPQ